MFRAIVCAIALLTSSGVLAKNNGEWDHLDDRTKRWFKDLQSPNGIPCCDVSDGHLATWRRTEEGNFEVFLQDKWTLVPPEVVLKDKMNPVGEAIVWTNPYGAIRCFLASSEF